MRLRRSVSSETDACDSGGSTREGDSPPRVLALETLDCARKIRIHYHLSGVVGEKELESFPGVKVDVQRFSERVAGAKDHFTLIRSDELRAAGVLGEDRIVATYGKTGGARPDGTIRAFERAIAAAGLGEVKRP